MCSLTVLYVCPDLGSFNCQHVREMTSGGMFVLFSSDSSLCRRIEITQTASFSRTLVNKLTTSNLTIRSSFPSFSCLMYSTKWVDFYTKDSVQPTSGDNTLASCFASWHIGEPMVNTIGCSGKLASSIFGNPYIWGGGGGCWGVRNIPRLLVMYSKVLDDFRHFVLDFGCWTSACPSVCGVTLKQRI